MYKAKKILCIGLSVVFVATAAFTGCGKKDDGKAGSQTPSTTATEQKLPPAELIWTTVQNPQKDIAQVQEAINKYTKEKINATVKLDVMDMATYPNKYKTMLAAGDKMDIVFTSNSWGYSQEVAKGSFLDITDLIDKYAPQTKAALHPALLEGTKVNGKNYAIPTQKELAHTYGFLYRSDIAEKYNMDLTTVKKYEDLEPFLKIIKEKEPNLYPLEGMQRINPMMFVDFDPVGDAGTPGKLYPNKDTKVINHWETPEAKALLETQRKFFQAGYMRQDAALVSDKNPDQKAGKNFIITGSMKPFVDEDVTIALGFKYKYVDLTKPFITAGDTQGSLNAIARTSQNAERAVMFLELVNTDKYLNNLINYGIENVHYVKKSDNVIDFAPGLDAKTTGYYPNLAWVYGNQFLNYLMVGQNPAKWDKYKEFNSSAAQSKLMGFVFDPEPVKTEIAACANVSKEFDPILATGSADVATTLAKYMEKWKAAGSDRIIAEKQKQIDAWLASKK